MDTSRISVEVAEKLGSASLSRPWSKYTEGSSANGRLTEASKHMESSTPTTGKGPKVAVRRSIPDEGLNPIMAGLHMDAKHLQLGSDQQYK